MKIEMKIEMKMKMLTMFTLMLVASIHAENPQPGKESAVLADFSRLPDGTPFAYWECKTTFTKTYYVSQKDPKASDANPGTEALPFLTIGKAAALLQPGERVVIGDGLYREFVRPARGGTGNDKMISYEAAPGAKVIIDGTEVWKTDWVPSTGIRNQGEKVNLDAKVWHGELPRKAFDGSNPFGMVNMPSTPWSGVNVIHRLPKDVPDAAFQNRRGLLFVDGHKLEQVVFHRELWSKPGTYWVQDDGLNVHFRLPDNDNPATHLMEFTTREQVFSPAVPYTAYLRVQGLRFERVGNGFPGEQRGALSTNCGNHWIIENNEIHWANSVGIDFGNRSSHNIGEQSAGYHIVQRNLVTNCGITGICGVVEGWKLHNTVIQDNVMLNNCWQNAEPLWENASIKIHLATNCLIRHNIIQGTLHGAGIWVDYNNSNTRVCNNVILNIETIHAGIFIEASTKPNLVDNNVVYGVKGKGRQDNLGGGHGIYEHNCDFLSVRNNFVSNVFGAAVCLNPGELGRVVNGRTVVGRKNRVVGNILADSGYAIILPNPDNFTDQNIFGNFKNSGPLRIQEPMERNDLEAWRNFHSFELRGKSMEIQSELDLETWKLKLTMKEGDKAKKQTFDLKQGYALSPFIEDLLK